MEPIHTEKVEVSSSGSSLELANRLAEEMAQRWAIGENPTADDYFVAFPDIRTDVQSAIRLIHEEVCQRQERGDPLKTEEVLSRYPQWRAELEIVLGCHQLLYDEAEAMPQVGDRILDYRLLAELSRGGEGTVFIAEQIHLAHRLVVLKITERTGQEHKSLARLQHTGIVPLLTAHEDSSRSLRILFMPLFG